LLTSPVASISSPQQLLCAADVFGLWQPPSQLKVSALPLEQVSFTHDTTDYLLYQLTEAVNISEAQLAKGEITLFLANVGDYAQIQLRQHSSHGSGSLSKPVLLTSYTDGVNLTLPLSGNGFVACTPATLQILSSTMGLLTIGTFMERWSRGLVGAKSRVIVDGQQQLIPAPQGTTWVHQAGLRGEALDYAFLPSTFSVWNTSDDCLSLIKNATPLMWFRLTLKLPLGEEPASAVFAVNMEGMGKGALWVNGYAIGRYWLIEADANACKPCSYIGSYSSDKCRSGCGQPSQQYYSVPRAWLRDGDNEITLLEEHPGLDPRRITIVRRDI